MEKMSPNSVSDSLEADILSLWLHSFTESESDECKISALAQRFNISVREIIKVVKNELRTEYLTTLSDSDLAAMYRTLHLHPESSGNMVQMEIIKSILYERGNTSAEPS
jgi:hypothetical protein